MRKKTFGIVCLLALSSVLGATPTYSAPSGAFAQHYDAAQSFLEQGQYSSAIVSFRKALRINYMDNSARIGLINSYLARGTYYANQERNFEKAANDFRSAIFYLKIFPTKEQAVSNATGMIASTKENLNRSRQHVPVREGLCHADCSTRRRKALQGEVQAPAACRRRRQL